MIKYLKNILLPIVIFIIAFVPISSCKKSLISSTKRLSAKLWVSDIIVYREREININDIYKVEFSHFEKNEGIFDIFLDTITYHGAVRLEESNTRLIFTEINYISGYDTIVGTVMNSWKIIELNKSKLWIETNIENNDVEIKFFNN